MGAESLRTPHGPLMGSGRRTPAQQRWLDGQARQGPHPSATRRRVRTSAPRCAGVTSDGRFPTWAFAAHSVDAQRRRAQGRWIRDRAQIQAERRRREAARQARIGRMAGAKREAEWQRAGAGEAHTAHRPNSEAAALRAEHIALGATASPPWDVDAPHGVPSTISPEFTNLSVRPYSITLQ